MEAAIKWILAAIIATWVSLSAAVQFLIIFMVFDYATGLIAATINKELDSHIGSIGLAKKVLVLALVWVAHLGTRAINVGYDLGSLVATAYCLNELISIVENCARVGVPIPPRLVQALRNAHKLWDGEERRSESDGNYAGRERRQASSTRSNAEN